MEIRKLNTPPVSSLVKKSESGVADKSECFTFIKSMIVLLNQYFGASWSDFQLTECSQDLYFSHFYWTIADWKLFAKKVKTLEYEAERKLFGAFTPDKLMGMASKYDVEWAEASQRISEGNHNTIIRVEKEWSKEDRMKADQDAKAFNEIFIEHIRNEPPPDTDESP